MNNVHVRAAFIIKFAYHPAAIHQSNQAVLSMESEETAPVTEISATTNGKLCAVCGSRLHMTKHCPVHP